MTYSTIPMATSRNKLPTIQCRVQKQAPEARKISAAAMAGLLTVCDQATPVQYWMSKRGFDGMRGESVKL